MGIFTAFKLTAMSAIEALADDCASVGSNFLLDLGGLPVILGLTTALTVFTLVTRCSCFKSAWQMMVQLLGRISFGIWVVYLPFWV